VQTGGGRRLGGRHVFFFFFSGFPTGNFFFPARRKMSSAAAVDALEATKKHLKTLISVAIHHWGSLSRKHVLLPWFVVAVRKLCPNVGAILVLNPTISSSDCSRDSLARRSLPWLYHRRDPHRPARLCHCRADDACDRWSGSFLVKGIQPPHE